MKNIILIIKGFIIGAANIIPGVSGGTIMMSLGIYEDLIYSVNHFFSDKKKNIKFISLILTGVLLSLTIVSRVIDFAYDNFLVPTILLFVGLIVGSLPMLFKNITYEKFNKLYILVFLIPFLLVLSMNYFSSGLEVDFNTFGFFNYITLFIVGVVAAASMIIPGLSGSFMLILFGYYEPIISVIKDFTSFNSLISNGLILFVFGVGVLVGLFFVIKLIEYLLSKFKVGTYYAIIGFVSSSVISILIANFGNGIDLNVTSLILGFALLVFGFVVTYKLGDKS